MELHVPAPVPLDRHGIRDHLVVVGRSRFGTELPGDLLGLDPLVQEQLSGCVLEGEQRRAPDHRGPVLPRRTHVVLPDTHPRVDGHPLVRVRLGDVVERDLAVIPHDDVGEPHEEGEDLVRPERRIRRVRDVHVHLHHILDPAVPELERLGLHEGRVRHGKPEVRLQRADGVLPRLEVGGQVDLVVQRVLQ